MPSRKPESDTEDVAEGLIEALLATIIVLKMLREHLLRRKTNPRIMREALTLLDKLNELVDKLSAGSPGLKRPTQAPMNAPGIIDPDAHMRAKRYKTKDEVKLRVSGGWRGERTLSVSLLEPLNLTLRELVVSKILMDHGRAAQGDFMKMKQLLIHIAHIAAIISTPGGRPFWEYADECDVHRVLNALRDKVVGAGGSKSLFETSTNHGAGFRISTPPWNLSVEMDNVEEAS